MSIRVYLTGRMAVETPGGVIDESSFPSRQARLAFAFLALSAQRPVARDVLASAIWVDDLPSSWDAALKSIVSKLRTRLVEGGVGADPISSVSGCYQLRLPVDAWIDLEASARAIDVAEGAIRRQDIQRAWSEATVVTAIARRAFLPGEDLPWIDDVRSALQARHVRALETLAEVWILRNNAPLAISSASEAVGLEPFRETGYRLLMRAHALAGNRGEAIRTYDRCARIFADELGVEPDPETTALRDTLHARRAAGHTQTMSIAVTDIVGSTELTARLGDKRWSEVLARHDAVVRGAVEAAGGSVVKHLGDGFLVTFGSVGAALTALQNAQRALADIDAEAPITIRVGLHAGEPVEQDEDVFGLQVNVAARINALADPGVIIVSSVIRELAPPGLFEFGDPQTVTLKGVPGEITIYRVT